MKIIIFGGNGFIGRFLAKKIKQKNKVYIFGNKNYSNIGKNLIKYNKTNFTKIISKIKPDVIFFLSGNSYPNNTIKDVLHDFKSTNIVIQELLSALVSISYDKVFFYASSIAIYGSVKSKKNIAENFKINPESFYGNSKLIAEKQIEFISKISKFNSIILRFSSVYGPELKRQIIYEIIKKNIKHKKVTLKGSNTDERQFLYVKDCAQILSKLMYKKYKKYQIYNVSNGKKIKILDVVNLTSNFLNKKTETKFLNKFDSPMLPALSNKKILNKIGKFKFTSFKKGLKETIDWVINKKFI